MTVDVDGAPLRLKLPLLIVNHSAPLFNMQNCHERILTMQYPYAEFQNIMYLLPILKMKRKFDTSVSTVLLNYINIAAMYGRNQT